MLKQHKIHFAQISSPFTAQTAGMPPQSPHIFLKGADWCRQSASPLFCHTPSPASWPERLSRPLYSFHHHRLQFLYNLPPPAFTFYIVKNGILSNADSVNSGFDSVNSFPSITPKRQMLFIHSSDIRRHKREPPCKHINSAFPAFQVISVIRPAETADRRIWR